MEQLKIGKFTLTWLRGGCTYLDGGATFGIVPHALWSKRYPPNEQDQIELRADPILIQHGSMHMLLEAGLGVHKFDAKRKRIYGVMEESAVDRDLAELGLSAKEIDFVLTTHLHFDHASGLTTKKGDRFISTFKNALIYTTEMEWDEMRNPTIRSRNAYWKENWEPIQDQVQTYSNEIEILPGLKLIHTGGHCAGHAILQIESEGEKLIHMGDLMPTHTHQKLLWISPYDDYPMTTLEQKQIWITKGLEQQIWFSFYHDAFYRAIQWDQAGTNILQAIERKETLRK